MPRVLLCAAPATASTLSSDIETSAIDDLGDGLPE
jgi:hypothetical protein